MKIEPFKMRVTPEQSRRVQEIIFENGGEWRDGQTTVINTNFPCLAFELRGDGNGVSGWSDPFAGSPTFSDAEVPEIMYYQFINKYGKQMKNLKLEVGKAYLNRRGWEVKIVEGNGNEMFPFKGDDYLSYTLDGHWDFGKDSELDLIAEADAADTEKRTFKIPENTREISVSEMDGRIVIEFVPEAKAPKPGDVMVNEHGSVYVFKSYKDDGKYHKSFVWLGTNGSLLRADGWCFPGRPATPEEAQPLWDALKKAGKRWNPDTLGIEELPEEPKLTEREKIEEWLKTRPEEPELIAALIEEYIKHREAQQCK